MGEAIDPLLINNVCCNAQRICLVYRVYDEQCQKIPSFATELSTFAAKVCGCALPQPSKHSESMPATRCSSSSAWRQCGDTIMQHCSDATFVTRIKDTMLSSSSIKKRKVDAVDGKFTSSGRSKKTKKAENLLGIAFSGMSKRGMTTLWRNLRRQKMMK
jgi:hypothetical protein